MTAVQDVARVRWPWPARAAVVLLVVGVALAVLDQWAGGGAGSGSEGSSRSTAPSGLAAYADLLAGRGHPVSRLGEPMADAELDAGTTVVVSGDALDGADLDAVSRFLHAGGREIGRAHV